MSPFAPRKVVFIKGNLSRSERRQCDGNLAAETENTGVPVLAAQVIIGDQSRGDDTHRDSVAAVAQGKIGVSRDMRFDREIPTQV